MNIKTTLKASVAAAALFAIATPVATTANAADDTLKSGNKNSLTISGYVSRAFYYADDGTNDGLFNTANETGQSRVRWIASGAINENVTMGAMLELEVPKSNPDDNATFGSTVGDEINADNTDWNIRQEYVWVKHKTLGRISIGHTDAASNGGVQASFTKTGGTDTTMEHRWVGGNIQFLTKDGSSGGALFTTKTYKSVSTDLDFTSRNDNIKYTTPSFGGLVVQVSLQDNGVGEIGGRYKGKFGSISVDARAGYSEVSAASKGAQIGTSSTFDYILGGSIAILHDSGLNANFSIAKSPRRTTGTGNGGVSVAGASGGATRSNISGTIGYNAKIFAAGTTGFAVSVNRSLHISQRGDDAGAIAVSAAQYFDSVGATIALAYRNYSYENERVGHRTIDDIDIFGVSTVFNF